MRKAKMFLGVAFLASTVPARADTICEWMGYSGAVANSAEPTFGPENRTSDHGRALTQVTLAMFEAVNSINRRYAVATACGGREKSAAGTECTNVCSRRDGKRRCRHGDVRSEITL